MKTLLNKTILNQDVADLAETLRPSKKLIGTRENLLGVRLNCNEMYASNGHFIIKDRKSSDIEADNITVMPEKRVKNCNSQKAVSEVIDSDCTGKVVTDQGTVLQTNGWDYPDITDVFAQNSQDQAEHTTTRIAFNAEYLASIAEYLSKDMIVTLEITSPNNSIRIIGNTRTSAEAILMPCKL